jgi:hypothetical protein
MTSPAIGDAVLACRGSAVAATYAISITPSTVAFGSWPVGSAHPPMPITITNTGSRPQTVTSSGVSADGVNVAPFNTPLSCGQSTTVSVAFTPPTEGFHEAFLQINHQTGGGQQGFQTVKTIVLANTGDGPLEFHADISGRMQTCSGCLTRPARSPRRHSAGNSTSIRRCPAGRSRPARVRP